MARTAKLAAQDRRKRYRFKAGTKVLVNLAGRFSEVATIENMTRNGLYFHALGDFHKGMWVELIFPYDPASTTLDRPRHAEVVRVEELENPLKKGVAVKLLNVHKG